MYKISPVWNAYYREKNPDRRAEMLKTLLVEEPDDGSNRFRKMLFSRRYLRGDNPKPSVDMFLWQCVNYIQIYDASLMFRKRGRKEAEQFLSDNGYNEAMAGGPEGERALYWEIRNAAGRYFDTCRGSEYRRSLFGLLRPGSGDQKRHMALETWKMTEGIGERLNMSDVLAVWTKAVLDEYCLTDPSAMDRINEIRQSGGTAVESNQRKSDRKKTGI